VGEAHIVVSITTGEAKRFTTEGKEVGGERKSETQGTGWTAYEKSPKGSLQGLKPDWLKTICVGAEGPHLLRSSVFPQAVKPTLREGLKF